MFAWFISNLGPETQLVTTSPVLQVSFNSPALLESLDTPVTSQVSPPILLAKPSNDATPVLEITAPAPQMSAPATPTETQVSGPPLLRTFEARYFLSKELTEKPIVLEDINQDLRIALPGIEAQSLVLVLLINEEGLIDRVELEKTNLPMDIATQVINTFSSLKFQPGKIDHIAVKSQLKIEVQLENSLPPLHLGGAK